MNTKLTLSIDKTVIEKAKIYAGKSGRSLSEMVQSYLEKLIALQENSDASVPEAFRDIYASVNLPDDLNDKEAIRKIVQDKYGK